MCCSHKYRSWKCSICFIYFVSLYWVFLPRKKLFGFVQHASHIIWRALHHISHHSALCCIAFKVLHQYCTCYHLAKSYHIQYLCETQKYLNFLKKIIRIYDLKKKPLDTIVQLENTDVDQRGFILSLKYIFYSLLWTLRCKNNKVIKCVTDLKSAMKFNTAVSTRIKPRL